ncbi:MAG: phosphopentomutase, partial [Candidatus Electryonea clarkiae]|nr:phosphopentomutase [Candidatus Electryonea clarkiae]
MEEQSAGKDSVTGHWEIAGLTTSEPFPVYPEGFPAEVVSLVEEVSGIEIIGNEVASGTEIMARLGQQHVESGRLILYTSADSVLQLLAHEEIVPIEELYRICEEIRRQLEPPHRMGRVIARPFIGKDGAFDRTPNRRDYSIKPPQDTILDQLIAKKYPVISIGKVDTLFDGKGFSSAEHTKNNADGINRISSKIRDFDTGLIFANLIDFDMLWGHRNDSEGFYKGLIELDKALPYWLELLRPDDLVIMTADHGNDPTTPSTDHSREQVPLLTWKGKGGNGLNLGKRKGFYDIAATLGEFFDVDWNGEGVSFLQQLN